MLMAGFLPFSAIYIELCEQQQPPIAAQDAAASSGCSWTTCQFAWVQASVSASQLAWHGLLH